MTRNYHRINWIDMARGYGIILVIIGHLYIFKISSWIYSFHMPLFFLLSGYLFRRSEKFSKYFVKKLNGLIKPYVFLSLIIILYRLLEDLLLRKSINPVKNIVAFVLQRRETTLWFITCLFIIELMYYFVDKIKYSWIQHLVVALITLVGLSYEKWVGKALFWNVDVAFAAFGFFYIGVLCKKYNVIEKVNKRLSIIQKVLIFPVLLILNIGGAVINNKISGFGLEMMSCQYGFWPLTYLVALIGTAAVIMISMIFANRFVTYIGKNTWIFFGLHQAVILQILSIAYRKLDIFQNIQTSAIKSLLYAIVTIVIILVTSTILNELIIRTKLKWLLNK